MARIVFFCHDERSNIEAFEYYKQDLDALQALGHSVVVCTRYREIPARFDCLFVWWWTYAFWPVLLSRLLGRPCMVTGTYNFQLPPGFGGIHYHNRPIWQRALISFSTRFAALNLFVNDDELRECAKYFALSNARSYPHTVHDDYRAGPSEVRELAVLSLAWSGRQNLVRKGMPELFQALRILKDEGTPIRAYIAGLAGDGVGVARELTNELGIDELVTWLGPVSRQHKIDLMRRCELYVQPSRFEGFGLAIVESMGCGACVITCDVGQVRKNVGHAALYVRPGDAQDLAAAIKRAMSDAPLREGLQACAVERAGTHFSPRDKVENLRGYLAEVGIR